jgi:hypothetical protein
MEQSRRVRRPGANFPRSPETRLRPECGPFDPPGRRLQRQRSAEEPTTYILQMRRRRRLFYGPYPSHLYLICLPPLSPDYSR